MKRQDHHVLRGDKNQQPKKLFQGEEMKCAICGRIEKSDPAVESNWTVIEYGETLYYICPRELPLRPDASPSDFKHAYTRIFRKLGIE